jgi:hypothetical protein
MVFLAAFLSRLFISAVGRYDRECANLTAAIRRWVRIEVREGGPSPGDACGLGVKGFAMVLLFGVTMHSSSAHLLLSIGLIPFSAIALYVAEILMGTGIVPFPRKIAADNREKRKHPNISATYGRIQRDAPGSGIKTPTRERERRQEPGQKRKDETSDWAPFGLAQMVFGH